MFLKLNLSFLLEFKKIVQLIIDKSKIETFDFLFEFKFCFSLEFSRENKTCPLTEQYKRLDLLIKFVCRQNI